MDNNFDVNQWKTQKREERKKIYSLINDESLEIFKSPKRLKQYLDTQTKFDMYSVNNVILVSNQAPEATHLKSRQEWKKQRAFVNKDAKEISILEPAGKYMRDDGTTTVNFNVKKMIDISDTNSNLKKINKVYDNKLILKALFNKSSIAIESIDEIEGGANVLWNENDKVLYIRKGGIEFPSGVHELVKEIAKANLESKDTQEVLDFKCKCISYMVCKKLNIDVTSFNFNDIPVEFSELDSRQVKQELGEMRNIFEKINEHTGKYFDNLQRNKNKEER